MSAVEPGSEAGLALGAEDVIDRGPRVASTSLRERMRRHKAELEDRTTELFPVPNWDGILVVELRPVDWDDTEESIGRHSRRERGQILRTGADEIVNGTVAFYELDPEGEAVEQVEDARLWSQLLESYTDTELGEMPHEIRERTALIELCTDQGVMALSTTFRRWMVGAKSGIGNQVRRDFERT
jgi:hypothetical protein